jgi:hypothetical protein
MEAKNAHVRLSSIDLQKIEMIRGWAADPSNGVQSRASGDAAMIKLALHLVVELIVKPWQVSDGTVTKGTIANRIENAKRNSESDKLLKSLVKSVDELQLLVLNEFVSNNDDRLEEQLSLLQAPSTPLSATGTVKRRLTELAATEAAMQHQNKSNKKERRINESS